MSGGTGPSSPPTRAERWGYWRSGHAALTPRRVFVIAATRLWQSLTLGMLNAASFPLRNTPRRAALRFGNTVGKIAYHVGRSARRRALSNLRLAYGDTLTPSQRDALVRGVFRHFGRCIVDFVRSPLYDRAFLEANVSYEGWEIVEAAQAEGRGLLMFSGHLGDWEVLGRWSALVKGMKLTVVAKDPRDPALTRYLHRMRQNGGFTVLSKGASAAGLLRALKREEMISLLPDQNSGDLFVPFFGIPAGTVAGPASLALHSKAPLLPVFCLQRPDGGFHIECLPPLNTQATGNKEADVRRITTEMNAVLESVIRRYPDQWLWLHNRWKASFEEKNRDRAWTEENGGEAARADALRRR